MSLLRFLPKRWRERIENYAPRGFPDAAACGAFYDARTRLFGKDEAATLEYSSLEAQERLFSRAVDALPPHGRVLDIGCGLAHLVDFLCESDRPFDAYHGIDVSEAMLERAATRHATRDNVAFEHFDLTRAALPERSFDVAYILSVLGYPIGPDPMATMMEMLGRAFDACETGLVFSHVMNGRSDRTLAFATVPAELAERCERELGAKAAVHDDGEDFTYLISLTRSWEGAEPGA